MAGKLLLTELGDFLGGDDLVAGTAFGVEEGEQFPEDVGVGAVPKEGAVATDSDEVFVFEFFEVMGEGGGGDAEFGLDVAGD
jgi:hypothetical protein